MDITYANKDKNATDGREKFTDADANQIKQAVNSKVDKVAGKGLSTHDYNDAEKQKVANSLTSGDLRQEIRDAATASEEEPVSEKAVATAVANAGGSTTAAGETGSVQYKGADGKATGDSNFIWDAPEKTLKLHGDSFIWRVNNAVPSGNAVVEFLPNQLLAFRFRTASQDYLIFRSAGTPAQISNVQRELNTSISCPYVETQEGAESTSASSIIVGSITLAEGQMLDAVINVAAKTDTAARCISGTITVAAHNVGGTVAIYGGSNTAQHRSPGVGAAAGFEMVAGSGTVDIMFTGEAGQTYAVKAYAVKFGRF